MSSSCRSSAALLAAAAAVSAPAFADGSGYIQPYAELNAAYHTNLELAPSNIEQSASGYMGVVSAIFGYGSKRYLTELRPKIQYEAYQNRDNLKHVNAYLDLNTHYETLRSDWRLYGSYSRENSYAAQRPGAGYDTFNPNDPIPDATGRITSTSEIYKNLQLRPSYTHQFSERFGTNIDVYYQEMDIDANPPNPDVVSYKDANGEALLYWQTSSRSRFSGGVFSDVYETKTHTNKTTGQGLRTQYSHHWSPTYSGEVTADIEHTKVDYVDNTLDEASNNWAINFSVNRQAITSALRFDGGRTFAPSNGGTRTTYDQLHVQYYRMITQRWSYALAARLLRSREQGAGIGNNNRDYYTGFAQIYRELTRTWRLTGTYSYTSQKYVSDNKAATDNSLIIGVIYQALEPQR